MYSFFQITIQVIPNSDAQTDSEYQKSIWPECICAFPLSLSACERDREPKNDVILLSQRGVKPGAWQIGTKAHQREILLHI